MAVPASGHNYTTTVVEPTCEAAMAQMYFWQALERAPSPEGQEALLAEWRRK